MVQFKTFFPKECKTQLSCWNNEHILQFCRPEKQKEQFDICCQRSLLILCRLRSVEDFHTAHNLCMQNSHCSMLQETKAATQLCCWAQHPMRGAPPSTIQEALCIQMGHFTGSSFRVLSAVCMKKCCAKCPAVHRFSSRQGLQAAPWAPSGSSVYFILRIQAFASHSLGVRHYPLFKWPPLPLHRPSSRLPLNSCSPL